MERRDRLTCLSFVPPRIAGNSSFGTFSAGNTTSAAGERNSANGIRPQDRLGLIPKTPPLIPAARLQIPFAPMVALT